MNGAGKANQRDTRRQVFTTQPHRLGHVGVVLGRGDAQAGDVLGAADRL